jgi:hypothetical protein
MCPVVEIILRITRMYGLQGPTKENIPTSCMKQYTPPAQIKQTLHTPPGVTYAQITKQNSYAATNIEQDQHINQHLQQTSDIQDLKSLFEQLRTMLNLLTTVLTKLK